MESVIKAAAISSAHRQMLESAAIAAGVIEERGYTTVTARPGLFQFGFKGDQLCVPTLVVPIHSVWGGVVLYQHRPDQPRLNLDGKPVKYETPAGSRMAIDAHPRIQPMLADPRIPLLITEGVKKGDAAVSTGLCCIALLGVWNWRGMNAAGGKTALPDWEAIALNGRDVIICFDSDVMTKASVQDALLRLTDFLKARGANVRHIYLPDGADGVKVGLDDYLAAGHTTDELLALATAEIAKCQGADKLKPFEERIIDLADVPPPPAELPLLFGPYLIKAATHWLTGATGIGKSTIGFNIACALAEGDTLWDIECRPNRVLYLDLESGDVGRSLKLCRLYRDRERPRDRLFFLGDGVMLPAELPSLLSYVYDNAIDLVILDTARRCFRVKDENDNAEVYSRIVPVLDALKNAGVASLTFGHPAKHDGTKARGAGAQEDAGDVNLSLTIHSGEPNSPNAVVALKITKHRLLGLENPPLYLRRAGEDRFERVGADEIGTSRTNEPGGQLQCAADLLQYLEERQRVPTRYNAMVEAMKGKGHSEATIKRTIKRLTTEETIETGSQGYTLADPFADK